MSDRRYSDEAGEQIDDEQVIRIELDDGFLDKGGLLDLEKNQQYLWKQRTGKWNAAWSVGVGAGVVCLVAGANMLFGDHLGTQGVGQGFLALARSCGHILRLVA